ncbi:MAG TPA: heme exporter protein CcmB [bacterium]|nr:heme exporter protein CcmB [bacterium]
MRVAAALIWKDVLAELRTRELVTSMSLVAFLALTVQGLAVGGAPAPPVTAAVLWITVVFAATLGLARTQALEHERDAFAGVLLAPVGRGTLFLAKAAANLLLTLLVMAVVVLAETVLVDPALGRRIAVVALPLVLGGAGFAASGTLLGAMASATRLREVLLPILLVPVSLPAIVVSLSGVTAALEGASFGAVLGPVRFLIAFDVIVVVLGVWLFEYVVDE